MRAAEPRTSQSGIDNGAQTLYGGFAGPASSLGSVTSRAHSGNARIGSAIPLMKKLQPSRIAGSALTASTAFALRQWRVMHRRREHGQPQGGVGSSPVCNAGKTAAHARLLFHGFHLWLSSTTPRRGRTHARAFRACASFSHGLVRLRFLRAPSRFRKPHLYRRDMDQIGAPLVVGRYRALAGAALTGAG
jgi:hypothetical protein